MKDKNPKNLDQIEFKTTQNKISNNSYVDIELLKSGLYWFTFAIVVFIFAIIFIYFLRNSKQI
jgi:hypothetical protein